MLAFFRAELKTGIMKTIKNLNGFYYVETLPDKYKEGEKLPVVVHYHGHGWAQKESVDFCENYTVLRDMQKYANEKSFVIIMPLCYEDSWFDCFSELKNFTRGVLKMPFADTSRIYLSGISMGGCVAWQMLCTLNDIFAAGVICCGIPMYWDVRRRLKAPVWAFHGLDDEVIYAEETKKISGILMAKGKIIKTTFYEGVAHRCWDFAYVTDELYDWLLSYKKEEVK